MASSDSKSFSSSNIISMEQLRLCTDHIWTDRELKFLRDNYNELTYDELATRLNRSKRAIENRVYNFKLRKSGTRWTTAEVQYLKDNYDTISRLPSRFQLQLHLKIHKSNPTGSNSIKLFFSIFPPLDNNQRRKDKRNC